MKKDMYYVLHTHTICIYIKTPLYAPCIFSNYQHMTGHHLSVLLSMLFLLPLTLKQIPRHSTSVIEMYLFGMYLHYFYI